MTDAAIRSRLALALDFDDSVVALRWAARLKDYFGVAKVGLELFSASGPSVVAGLVGDGFEVFIDLKLADIPNTTRRAARVLGSLGASYLTVHASAGTGTLRAGVEGFAEGAESAGFPVPVTLAVTVLTSDPDASPELLRARVRTACEAGCGGVVCAAPDLAEVNAAGPGLLKVVPGIRLAGSAAHDQSRTATPGEAMRAGAGILVIGRAVTDAPDPVSAAEAIVDELSAAVPAGGA
ncbi:MAG TPA: orotidine-5'-phosphate decarboxylase [Acidimicrobiales bacterium]|nr:orotidine-5'-phosphate decarboxylase [Acidimicrobiales bacterium]